MDPFLFVAIEQVIKDENNIVFEAGGGLAVGAGAETSDGWIVGASYSITAPRTIGYQSLNAEVDGAVTSQALTLDVLRRVGGPLSVGGSLGYGRQTYDLDGRTDDGRVFGVNESVGGLAYRAALTLDAPRKTPLFAAVVYTSSSDRDVPMTVEGETRAVNPGINRSYAVRFGLRYSL